MKKYKEWLSRNWMLVSAMSILFVIAISALIIAIVTTQSNISSDLTRPVSSTDAHVNLSLAAGKNLQHESNVMKNMMSYMVTNLTHVLNSLPSSSKKSVKVDFVSGNDNIRDVRADLNFLSSSFASSAILSLVFTTNAVGHSPTTFTVDLEHENLECVGHMICSSPDEDNIMSWNNVTPLTSGAKLTLHNPLWFIGTDNITVRLTLILASLDTNNSNDNDNNPVLSSVSQVQKNI